MTGLEITPRELSDMRERGDVFQLVDVRAPWEHDLASIPGDVLIPLQNLAEKAGQLDASIPVVVYCHQGARSYAAARALREAGYDATSLRGGIDLWSLQIDPTVGRY
ncbi:MAG TPA: rhodanese-like domain-containing protein [Thermoanaerobaculia bacterium]|nr:rhodanese-like domain-containing protein [Thermoanaerobaculia bacterium]